MSTAHDYILPGLRKLAVPIDSLSEDPTNARFHDERNINAIVASLKTFKQRKPIVVQKQGMVARAGNGTLQAAKQLGWTHIAAVVVDEGNVDAAAYAIADNRSAELAAWDWPGLVENMQELDTEGFDLTLVGWDEGEVANLMEADWSPALKDEDALHSEAKRTITLTNEQWEIFDCAAQQFHDAVDTQLTPGAVVAALANTWLGEESK